MIGHFRKSLFVWAVICVSSFATTAYAQPLQAASSILPDGGYAAVLGSFTDMQRAQFSHGFGGVVAAGFHKKFYAVEGEALYSRMSSKHGASSGSINGGAINGLLFPLSELPGLYGLVSLGAVKANHYPAEPQSTGFSLITYGAGAGYIYPIRVGRYVFGVRGEALYQYETRDGKLNRAQQDIDVPHNFGAMSVRIGLQLPFSLSPQDSFQN